MYVYDVIITNIIINLLSLLRITPVIRWQSPMGVASAGLWWGSSGSLDASVCGWWFGGLNCERQSLQF